MTQRTIDELMDLDPLSLSDQDIDEIIAYQRQQRAKPGKKGPAGPAGPRISLENLFKPKAPTEPMKRRV